MKILLVAIGLLCIAWATSAYPSAEQNTYNAKETCHHIDYLEKEINYLAISTQEKNPLHKNLLATDHEYEYTAHTCFSIRNTSGKDQEINFRLENSRVRHVEIYQITNSTRKQIFIGGLEYPLNKWGKFGAEITLDVNIPASEEENFEVYAGSIHRYNTKIKIQKSESSFNGLLLEQTTTGLLAGIILSLIIYSAFIGFTTKDTTYLYLVGSTLFVTLLQLNDLGMLYPLWPNSLYWNNVCDGIFAITSTVFGIGLARSYLMTKENLVIADKVFRGLFWYLIFSLSLPLLQNDKLFFYFYAIPTVIIIIPALFVISIIRIRQNYSPAKTYLLALITPIIAGLTIFLMYAGVIPSSQMARVLPLTGTAIQLVLFASALGERINWLKKQQFNAMEAELKSITENTAKKNFLAHISHELRTPLSGIIGLSELAKKNPLYENNMDLIDGINSSAESLLATTNLLLDHARIDAGKWNITVENFNITDSLNTLTKTKRSASSQKNMLIKLSHGKIVPERISGDRIVIERIVECILDHAINSTSDGCILVKTEIKTLLEKSHLRFDIIITGHSLSADYEPRIFELFELPDNSTTRPQQGIGLNIALSKKFCELLGGTIGYENNPEIGTIFWLTIPLEAPAETRELRLKSRAPYDFLASPNDKTDSPILKTTTPKHGDYVLVAEDDETLRLIVSATLDKLGKKHFTYPNGKPLVEEYCKNHQNTGFILLDWNMPICNAAQAISAIRDYEKRHSLHPVKIAVLSAYDKNSAKELDISEDITFIHKPVKTEDLLHLFAMQKS